MKQTISIINQKGGVGKTTTAINLAAYLAKQGKRILIIDLDPQANATSGLGVDKNDVSSSVSDVFAKNNDIKNIVIELEIKNVYLIASDSRLASAEVDISTAENREYILRDFLKNVEGFDYILIDCPPALGLLTINALTASDKVLIPLQAEYFALEGLSQLLQVMQQVSISLNPDLELFGVVLTMYDKRNSLSEQVKAEAQTHFGSKLFSTMVPRNVRLAEAPSFGKTIADHDKWSKGARAYKSLAKEVIDRVES